MSSTLLILYRYLRLLNVKVSKATIQHLLDTPVGNSMRGISDALDYLNINNKVYQFPSSDYLKQLPTPFITILNDTNDFCIVTKYTDSIVDFFYSNGKSDHKEKALFLGHWTGIVLIGKVTRDTFQDAYYWWKNLIYYIKEYLWIICLLTFTASVFFIQSTYPVILVNYVYSGVLCSGLLISALIIFENENISQLLNHFCHIGKWINCERVLHSKGSSIAGFKLGELAVTYYFICLILTVILPIGHWNYSALLCTIACIFTLHSIIYQGFILHQGCLLCITIDILIWTQIGIIITANHNNRIGITGILLFLFLCFLSFSFLIGLHSLLFYRKKALTQDVRMNSLYNSEVFKTLLQLEPRVRKMPDSTFTLQNPIVGERRVLFVTNPNCPNCATSFPDFMELSKHLPISLLLTTFPKDEKGNLIMKKVLSAYLQKGWEAATQILSEWFDKGKLMEEYEIGDDTEIMWKEQLIYCWKQNIYKTPTILINGYYVPRVYQLSDLKYLLI